MLVVGDELAEHPFIELILRSLLALAHLRAQSLQLLFVELVRQIVQHVLRSSTLRLAHHIGILAELVGKELHLAP